MASATGHFSLQLTSSEDFTLQLRVNSKTHYLHMRMGKTRVVGFHPKTDIETLEVSFAREGKKPQDHVFAMSSSRNPSTEKFVFDEVVLFVHSIFECDVGYHGENCREISKTTTPSTNTGIMTTTTPAPLSTPSKLADPQVSMFNIVYYLSSSAVSWFSSSCSRVAHPEVKEASGRYWESCWDDEKSLDKKVARDEELQDVDEMFSAHFLVLFFLFSMASATGHLTLQMTPSEDFTLQLRIRSTTHHLKMSMGETRVVGFHPKTDIDTLEVSFSKEGMKAQNHSFAMSSSGNPSTEKFVFDEVVLFVHSIFGCDAGYLGDNCREVSTTTSTTTPATTAEIMMTTTTAPLSAPSKLTDPKISMSNIIIYLALVLSISGFLVLTVMLFFRNSHRQTIENIPEDLSQSDMDESGIYSKDSQRSISSLSSTF
ncbi:unnamed protein product [Caenorhabditis brenneri]